MTAFTSSPHFTISPERGRSDHVHLIDERGEAL